AEMQRRNRKIHFLVMGFPNVDHYRSYARSRGLADIMTFTGRVPFSDAPYFLAACDLAVAPKNSISEGSGKLLNYMAMGLPVVAYDTPVNREYLDDLGVYAPIGDVAAFSEAIIALSQDQRLRADLGQRLRQRVVENYSWEVAAERVARVYEMLTSR
ncbi:MAG TPA: glycosyltransferase, partial [Promineifilum sp.]